MTGQEKVPVGISSCLLGETVRYDGGHQLHSYIERTLGQYFQFHPFCPEMAIGLGVPRKPIRLVAERGGDDIRCVSLDGAVDYTGQLQDCAAGQSDWHGRLCGYILKNSSPSCGMERVKVWENTSAGGQQVSRRGVGIYAATLMRNFPHLPVEEEGRLGDAVLRENFIQRVYVRHRWHKLQAEGLRVSSFLRFHARHKLIIMSHDPNDYRNLDRLVADTNSANLRENAETYFAELMTSLRKIATRGRHVNVLRHIQGYLKQELDADDNAELEQVIENYHRGLLPLIVPVTLLNHHFRRFPDPYIADSWYMRPYPPELCLQNTL